MQCLPSGLWLGLRYAAISVYLFGTDVRIVAVDFDRFNIVADIWVAASLVGPAAEWRWVQLLVLFETLPRKSL